MPPPALATSPIARRLARIALWMLGVVVVLAIALWLGVPPLLRHVLETRVAAALARPVSVGRITFNPLHLATRVEGLAVGARDKDAPPLLRLDAATLELSFASLWHRAPVLDRVLLERPRLAIARNADGSYSVQDLIDAALAGGDGPPTRFSLNNIEVHGGEIDFDDRPRARRHTVRDLNIGIPFLSSLPYQTEIKVAPHISAKVNGTTFGVAGTTTPFAREREASLDVDLDALPITEYVAYLPVKLRAIVSSGALTTHARLVFTEGAPGTRTLWLAGEVVLERLLVKRPNGTDTLAVPRATAHVARLDFFNRTLVIDSVAVDKPVLDLRRLGNGRMEIADPWVEPAAGAAAAPAAGEASQSWHVDVEKAAIAGGTIRVDDAAVRPAYRVTYNDVTLDATDLSNDPAKRAHVAASLASEFGATAKADVDLVPMTLEASGHVAVDKLSLKRFYPYYASVLALEVQGGSLSIAGDVSYVPDAKAPKLTVTAGSAVLDDVLLALSGEHAPLWRMPHLAAGGITIDVAAKHAEIATLESRGGTLAIAREADGRFNFARMLRASSAPRDTAQGGGSGTAAGVSPEAVVNSPEKSGETPWAVSVRRTVFDRYAIDFADAQPSPAVALKLRNVDLTAEDLGNVAAKRAHVDLTASVGDGGRIALRGPLATRPVAAELALEASGIALPPLQPYIDPYVGVTMTAGTASAKGRVAFGSFEAAASNAPAPVRFSGAVGVDGFAAQDSATREDLMRWGRLALDNVEVATDGPRVAIGEIALEDYFARVVVHEDASVNLVTLMTPHARGASAAPAAAAAPPPAPAPPAATTSNTTTRALPVSIGRIALARGEIRYADFYVKPNYSADLTDVAGTVSAMSPTQAGTVDIAAKVARTAPVTIKGTLNPFAHDLALDLTGAARDVDLPPLSPYAIKYAGYGITKGTLSFDVHYKVEDRKLAADNKLVLDQLTFGEHVDSPTATKLPVLLAVSLLKDVNGVIDIDLPVSGSLDDPQFSVGGLIVKVIVNLLTKAVTAPFALLGAAFGGGEELSYIAFAPGSAELAADASAKLDKLGKALAARPALKLDIAGRSDPAADAEAIREHAVERAIRAQKVKALADAGTPAPDANAVTVGADERERYLLAAYKDAPIKERPRNFIGMLKDVPPADMEKMLRDHADAGDDAQKALAQRRAQAVKEALIKRGIAGERVFVVAGAAQKEIKGAPPTRADLTLK